MFYLYLYNIYFFDFYLLLSTLLKKFFLRSKIKFIIIIIKQLEITEEQRKLSTTQMSTKFYKYQLSGNKTVVLESR